MALRVVFADDNLLVREGVAALLAEVEGIELVDALVDSASLVESVAKHRPDVALTDIRMPPSFTNEGIEAAKRIRAEHPSAGVVVLRSTSRRTTPSSCWPTESAAGRIS